MTLEVNRAVLDWRAGSIRRVISGGELFEAVIVDNKFFSLTKIGFHNGGQLQVESVEVQTGILVVSVLEANDPPSLHKLLTFSEPLGVNP